MLPELRQRASQAVDLAQRSGADEAWAVARRNRSVLVDYRDGQIERIQESTERGISLRVYVSGRYATHNTNDLRASQLEEFVRAAVELTGALERDPFREIPDPVLFRNRPTDDLALVDSTIPRLTVPRRVEAAREVHEEAHNDPQVISAFVEVGDSHSLSAAASSNGFSGEHERTTAWRGGTVTMRGEGDARPTGHHWESVRHLEDIHPTADIGREVLRQARRVVGAAQGPTLRTTMVVEPRAGRRLISALLGPATARAISQRRSFWQERLGSQVFAERLRIVDDPLIARGLGSRFFDAEGISARSIPIVENGVARNIYVDTYYGRKIQSTPTTGSISNLSFTLGERNLEQTIGQVSDGYLVTSWLGGNSDAVTGDFSFGMRGNRIENGALGAPVQEMNVTGNLVDLFAALAAVGNDPWTFSSYRTPTLVFENVQFAGT